MILCPNCNGNLKFDIASQKMHCAYCDTYADPEKVKVKPKDADSQKIEGEYAGRPDMMEVTIFSCPQCGAELMSTDTDATAFCSYCGAANILSERISLEKRPDNIIPFQITKEQCKESYKKKLSKAIFAPKELKDSKYIDGFRGIYMPYWSYDIEQKGPIYLEGTKEHRSGDYRIIDHYNLSLDIDNSFKGLTHDASTSFADNISESLAPFKITEEKNFKEAYLSGFYADIADVKSETYEEEMEHIAAAEALSRVKKEEAFREYSVSSVVDTAEISKTHTKISQVKRTMLPVWFMSYRNGDRIAYAAVNGQTGKVTADIPIDARKYITYTIPLVLIIWAILYGLSTFTLAQVLNASIAGALMGNIVCAAVLTSVAQSLNLDTLGKGANNSANLGWGCVIGIIAAAVSIFLPGLIPLVIAVVICAYNIYKMTKHKLTKGVVSNIALSAGMIISTIIVMCDPPEDYWYFIPSLVLTAFVVWCYIDVLYYYNQIMTRPLPQFNKQGGDDNA